MARKNKYLKFGNRADRNLSDVSDPVKALDNILDNLSQNLDQAGNTLSFTGADIAPLIGLAQSGLADRLTTDGQALALVGLGGNTVQVTNAVNTLIDVAPRLTIQDYIDNYKSVLGDPPWVNGGQGPDALLIPSNRLNARTTDSIGSENIEPVNALSGARYRYEDMTAGATLDEITTELNAISGQSRPNGTQLSSTSAGNYYIVWKLGDTSNWAAAGASASPKVGEVFLGTSTSITGTGRVVQAKAINTTLVTGRIYTIIDIGADETTMTPAQWSDAGLDGCPYVGKEFVCGADTAIVGDAIVTDVWVIGSQFDCTVNGSSGTKAKLRNVTHPTGNSETTATPANLKASSVWTKKDQDSVSSPYTRFVGPVKAWEDGRLTLNGQIDGSFPDTFGGYQWTGYQSNRFETVFETNAYYTIEEDIVDDTNNPDANWKLLKAVVQNNFKTNYPVLVTTVDEVTRLEFTDEIDYKRVTQAMECVIGDSTAEVNVTYKRFSSAYNSNKYYAELSEDFALEDVTGKRIVEFNWDATNVLTIDNVDISRPASGARRHVRYTAWWPALTGQDAANFPSKEFNEVRAGSERLSYKYFYTDSGITTSYGKYTFPYFDSNRVKLTNQSTATKLTVNKQISLEYQPKQSSLGVFPDHNESTNIVSMLQLKVTDNSGTIETYLNDSTLSKVEVGDWITVIPNFEVAASQWGNTASKAYSFQVLSKIGDNKVFVDPNFAQGTQISVNDSFYAMHCKNEGLVGIFKQGGGILGQARLSKLNVTTGSMNVPLTDVSIHDNLFAVRWQGSTNESLANHNFPYYLNPLILDFKDSGGTVTSDIGNAFYLDALTVAHPREPNGWITNNLNAYGIAFVYASRGLTDNSAAAECGGVYGLEVGATATANDTTITVADDLTSVDVSTNDYVYFVGPDAANPVIKQKDISNVSTQIQSKNTNGGVGAHTITLTQAITADLAAGTTLVLTKDTAFANVTAEKEKNREYCIIPLNTAPPFESTDEGLATPANKRNLILKKLVFDEIEIDIPENKIIPLSGKVFATTGSTHSFTIENNGSNFKVLINNSTLSNAP